jgi:Protein of unknown function (DUF2946)
MRQLERCRGCVQSELYRRDRLALNVDRRSRGRFGCDHCPFVQTDGCGNAARFPSGIDRSRCYSTDEMISRRGHRAHRRTTWLAIFALLLQTIIPALHHPATMALGATDFIGHADHICMPQGENETAPASHDKSPGHHQSPSCPICQGVHAIGGFAQPAGSQLPCVSAPPIGTALDATAAQPRLRFEAHRQPRAPPVIA